ncbi:hypothetical protein GCM10011576_51560 [Micromonospora parathelypteridis]|nr:hypothetical protein GCM10011576_51560 [Micromonospora parathelypteridis]
MRLRQQRVQRHHLVPLLDEQVDDLRSDEPGRAGDQYPHSRHGRAVRMPGGPVRVTREEFTTWQPGKRSVMRQTRPGRTRAV